MIKVVEVDVSDLVKAFRRLGINTNAVIPIALTAGAEVFQEAANRDAPGPHIEVSEPTAAGKGMEVSVGPDDDHWYYRFAETGVVAHRVSADNAQVLRMGPTGGEFFRRYAQHPGHAARPFLRPAFDEHTDDARDAVGSVIKRVLK